MTTGNVFFRAFARVVCKWCLEQDDLQGFYVGAGGMPDRPFLRVELRWPNNWHSMKDYPVEDVRFVGQNEGVLLAPLEAMAREARQRADRIADPNRLPG